MSDIIVKPEELCGAINSILSEWSDAVIGNEKKAVDIVSEEVNNEIKSHIAFKRHKGDKYVKAFRIKTVEETALNKKNNWCVVNGQYRLTHLLENGHLTRDGQRTRAYPHIEYGEELAQARMIELSEEAVKNA